MIETTLMSIDPGGKGGVAWINWLGEIHARPLPAALTPRLDMLRDYVGLVLPPMVIVEDVGAHRVGNSARASAALARDVGQLEACLGTLGVPIYWVTPKTWQKAKPFNLLPKLPRFPAGTEPEDKTKARSAHSRQHKRLIKRMMEEHYPMINMTLATADAVGILHWALQSPAVATTIETSLAMRRLNHQIPGDDTL